MYTTHRDKILQYEATYGNINGTSGTRGDWIDKANSADYGYNLTDDPYDPLDSKVHTLRDELFTAANVLMQEYQEYIKDENGAPRSFDPLNIQVSSNGVPVLYGESYISRTGSNDDLLIGRDALFGMFGADYLYGGAGDDVLIGGSGDDYLDRRRRP